MDKINVIVVDDEAPARNKLKRYMLDDDRVNLIAEAADGT